MKNTTTNRILCVLRDGPAIASEVCLSLNMDQRLCNAFLCSMYKRGRLVRDKFFGPNPRSRKWVYIYSPRGRRGIPV